jgi:hypothetical protein
MNQFVQFPRFAFRGLLLAAALLVLGVEVGHAQLIMNPPPPPPTPVSIYIEEIKYVAPADGVVYVKVWLSAAATDTVTVQFATADGAPPNGATSPADYTSTSGTLVFSAGQTEKYIAVIIVKTSGISDKEYFSITLSSPSSNATVGVIPCFVYISPPPTVQFTAKDYSVTEGTDKTPGHYTKEPITVVLSAAAPTDVTVKYNFVGGTATPKVDYQVPDTQIVTILKGQTSGTFTVNVVPDSKIEANETVKLVLSPPSGVATLGIQSTATLTIIDDDQAPPVKKIFVYAFDGAGSIALKLDPLKNVERQAIEQGAEKIGYKVAYRWHNWAGGIPAGLTLALDQSLSNKDDKFVTIGYSWGGRACRDFAVLREKVAFVKTKWDFVLTIDPVNGIPKVPFLFDLDENAWEKRWVNYWEKVDEKSLLSGLPIRGQPIKGTENIEFNADEFKKKQFYLNANKVTAYPDGLLSERDAVRAHIYIPYNKVLLDNLSKRIEDLK